MLCWSRRAQKAVVACVRVAAGGAVHYEVRSFGTTTRALLTLADWLREALSWARDARFPPARR